MERRLTIHSCHFGQFGERRLWVDYCLLEKSNIRKTCKACSDHKPAVHNSERPVSLALPGTTKYGQTLPFP
jgi:hypothetical protein